MKKISADYIFPGNSEPIKNGVVCLDENDVIEAVLDPQKEELPRDGIIQHSGIICPGFVNTHCHLELSYLKGAIAEKTYLHGFIKDIVAKRNNFSEEERIEAMKLAEKEMLANGIVAVGDISNGDSSFPLKQHSKIRFHTFIEVFGSDPKVAQDVFNHSKELYDSYFDQKVSITPHATYSVSDPLTALINTHATKNDSLISIHNQETESENEFHKSGSGHLYDFLEIDKKNTFLPSGENALSSFLSRYKELNKVLLVHNTFTRQEDIDWANKYHGDIYWCFCPNANLYIEGALPDFNLFLNEKCTIGTDSYASNWSLSVLDELKTIQKNTDLPLRKLIEWATFNGAKFLGFKELGSIEKGKSPGLNLIKNISLDKLQLTDNSSVSPL